MDQKTWELLFNKLDGIDRKLDKINGCIGEHDIRIRSVEVWRGYVIGIAAGLSAVISGIISWLKSL